MHMCGMRFVYVMTWEEVHCIRKFSGYIRITFYPPFLSLQRESGSKSTLDLYQAHLICTMYYVVQALSPMLTMIRSDRDFYTHYLASSLSWSLRILLAALPS